MIARLWQGLTRAGMGNAYMAYLTQTGLAEYAASPGCRGSLVLREPVGDRTRYLIYSFWDDMDAVRGFAGPTPERAVYYPDDIRYFPVSEMRPAVQHYEVAAADLSSGPASLGDHASSFTGVTR